MNRIEMVSKLINEGLSRETLVNFTDKQLKSLCNRMLGEQVTPLQPKQPAFKIGPKGGELPSSPKGYTISQNPNDKTITAVTKESDIKEGKKKPTQKQLSTLDKNKNKKIDKQDFELLRKEKSSKKSEVKDGGEKWIQKAIDPSKKGSLKKALGVKKDEKIPETKLKSASKKGGKLGQKARLAMTLRKLKENQEVSEWINNLAETNYHPFTSKGEIMELLQKKLNETETMVPMPKKAKVGHNGVPEFMTYDSIMSSTKEKESPTTKPGTKTPPSEKPKPNTPYQPGPGKDPKPKALAEKKK